MIPDEKPEFERLLKELFGGMGMRPPDVEAVAGFWKSLGRVSIIEFTRACEFMLAQLEFSEPPKYLNPSFVWGAVRRLRARGGSATGSQSVREQLLDLAERDPQHNGHLKAAIALNDATWAEFERRDPELAALELGIAQWGLILARDPPDSPQYAEARREDWKFREARRQLIERRQADAEKRGAA